MDKKIKDLLSEGLRKLPLDHDGLKPKVEEVFKEVLKKVKCPHCNKEIKIEDED